MQDFVNMTNEELKTQYEILWSRYMYYQAAEGNWNQEREAREAATKEYWDCIDEMKKRNISEY